jgi:hypothetical protein
MPPTGGICDTPRVIASDLYALVLGNAYDSHRAAAHDWIRHDDSAAGRLDDGESNVISGRGRSPADALGLYVSVQAEPALLQFAARSWEFDPRLSRSLRVASGVISV